MNTRPRIGLTGEHTFTVEPKHVIEFAGDGMPAVLSTPNLIGSLERTARQVLVPLLDTNERTVGAEIELRHLAPTPLGASVTLQVRVIHAEGSLVTFTVEARDEHEVIARGLHRRAVIRVENFAKRVGRKTSPTGS